MTPYFGAWQIQYTFPYEENHYLTKYYAVKIKVTGLEWQVSERINVRAIQQIQNLNWSQCSIKHFNVQIKNLTSFCRYFCFSCAWDFSPCSCGTYLPERSVTWTKVSLKDAKMWQTPNTFSPSATWGPRLMTCSSFFSLPLRGAIAEKQHSTIGSTSYENHLGTNDKLNRSKN